MIFSHVESLSGRVKSENELHADFITRSATRQRSGAGALTKRPLKGMRDLHEGAHSPQMDRARRAHIPGNLSLISRCVREVPRADPAVCQAVIDCGDGRLEMSCLESVTYLCTVQSKTLKLDPIFFLIIKAELSESLFRGVARS